MDAHQFPNIRARCAAWSGRWTDATWRAVRTTTYCVSGAKIWDMKCNLFTLSRNTKLLSRFVYFTPDFVLYIYFVLYSCIF